MLSVCARFVHSLAVTRAKGVIKFQAADSYLSPACNTKLNIAISYGGPAWPISDTDLNLGAVSSGLCLGAIFDITAGSNVKPTSGTPEWIVGDTFLVRFFLILWSFSHPDQSVFSTRTQKNVYTVFRSNPPAVGFAQLSSAAGGSSGSQSFFSRSAIVYTMLTHPFTI